MKRTIGPAKASITAVATAPRIAASISALREIWLALFLSPAPMAQATPAVVPILSATRMDLVKLAGLLVSPTAAIATADISLLPSMMVSTMVNSWESTSSNSAGSVMASTRLMSFRSRQSPFVKACIATPHSFVSHLSLHPSRMSCTRAGAVRVHHEQPCALRRRRLQLCGCRIRSAD